MLVDLRRVLRHGAPQARKSIKVWCYSGDPLLAGWTTKQKGGGGRHPPSIICVRLKLVLLAGLARCTEPQSSRRARLKGGDAFLVSV